MFIETFNVQTPNIDLFINYIKERRSIQLKKEAGLSRPWTDDPILNEYRFCNVDREDDTVTIWINDNIRVPFADHPDMWLMLALSRWINWPQTLAYLIDSPYWFGKPGFSLEGMADVMQYLSDNGVKVYTGAYMIRAESDRTATQYGKSKHYYITLTVIGRLMEHRAEIEALMSKPDATLQEVWTFFQQPYFNGWGPFMTYELITDLYHTHYLRHASDIMTWANAGPGAIRGLNRLYGRPLNQQPKPAQTNAEMQLLLADLIESGEFTDLNLDMRICEHTSCEVDKYLRVKYLEGRPRSRYTPQVFNTTVNWNLHESSTNKVSP